MLTAAHWHRHEQKLTFEDWQCEGEGAWPIVGATVVRESLYTSEFLLLLRSSPALFSDERLGPSQENSRQQLAGSSLDYFSIRKHMPRFSSQGK